MAVFILGSASGLKKITSDQVAKWALGNFFVPFGIPKMITTDADGNFSGMFKKNSQMILLIPVHAVTRINHKAIINERFYCYFNKVHNINSVYKVSLRQWLQGVFFALYAWNAAPVEVTYMA